LIQNLVWIKFHHIGEYDVNAHSRQVKIVVISTVLFNLPRIIGDTNVDTRLPALIAK